MELYTNNKYEVLTIDDLDERIELDDNYKVVNRQTGKIEYRSESLPQALAIAEQFAHLLANDYHLKVVKDMYGTQPPVFTVVDNDFDGSH